MGAGASAALGGLTVTALTSDNTDGPRIMPVRSAIVPFYGLHQAGIATTPQAHAVFIGLDFLPTVTREDVVRLLRILTDDASRLTQGKPALADTEPDIAASPARTTITIGFGAATFRLIGQPLPKHVEGLPSFGIDRLEAQWCNGDLLLQLCSDDPTTLAHTQRMLLKDTRAFARIRWIQTGFREATDPIRDPHTGRNLMGQLDGTINPRSIREFKQQVWIDDPSSPLHNGTLLVLRRIRMLLDEWDAVDHHAKETIIGRRLSDGSPLTGHLEHEEADLDAIDHTGLPIIAAAAHIRRARGETTQKFLRRGYNYNTGHLPDGSLDIGLIFAAYQADIDQQFLPIQKRLAKVDLLNKWTVPIGSAVFVIPPGCQEDQYIGHTLFR